MPTIAPHNDLNEGQTVPLNEMPDLEIFSSSSEEEDNNDDDDEEEKIGISAKQPPNTRRRAQCFWRTTATCHRVAAAAAAVASTAQALVGVGTTVTDLPARCLNLSLDSEVEAPTKQPPTVRGKATGEYDLNNPGAFVNASQN